MLRLRKHIVILWAIIILIVSLIAGIAIGCLVTPGSIVRTKTKVVTKQCDHVNLNEVGILEQSISYHCDSCEVPSQRILYDVKNKISYVYTYYYKYREGYSHHLELKNTEILRIQAEGDSNIIKR